jgi:hypothetical protein
MTFVSKQCAWHSCLNNMNKQMMSMSMQYKPMKKIFIWLLLSNEVCDRPSNPTTLSCFLQLKCSIKNKTINITT